MDLDYPFKLIVALKTNKEKNRLQEIRKMNLETIKCLLSFKKNNKKRV